MKALLIIISYCVIINEAKLIQKNKEKNEETQPTDSPQSIRISRQAFYEDGIGTSKEDIMFLDEDSPAFVRKGRYSYRPSNNMEPGPVRLSRDSKETTETKQQETTVEQQKTTRSLVKKPIPKFNDIDYEDFQGKMVKTPIKYAESGEHEDEDFNLDDYEFDVNHDEFIGRGKPLEPRIKSRESKQNQENIPVVAKEEKKDAVPPEIKIQSKVVIPAIPMERTKKNVIVKKAADKMKDDYYDDIITTTKVPDVQVKRELDDDMSDEPDDSKEYNTKNSVRAVRSSWNARFMLPKIGEKTPSVLSKVLGYLPLFPQRTDYQNKFRRNPYM